ncbi:MAG: DUF58 domain-containing protein [Lautropia sp.]|nr:DUF58 domain-containing protein [Lautropia sp.]
MARFARQRHPWEGDFPLTRRRVYVLPSRMGMIFFAALLVMLLLSINYGLSLGYVLVFLLAGVFWVSLFHAWRNLAGLVLRPGRADPVHAGETAELNLSFRNPTRLARYAITLDSGHGIQAQVVDIAADAEHMVSIALTTHRRGWQPAPALRLSSDFPLGLWRVWTRWHPAAGVLVWPAPERPASPLPQSHDPTGHAEQHQQGGNDFSHLRPYRAGDSLRQLAWRAMARHPQGFPQTRSFSDGGEGGELLFDWAQLPTSLDVEARLSRLAAWIEQAELASQPYALNLPRKQFATDRGPHQRAACLEALARFGENSPA